MLFSRTFPTNRPRSKGHDRKRDWMHTFPHNEVEECLDLQRFEYSATSHLTIEKKLLPPLPKLIEKPTPHTPETPLISCSSSFPTVCYPSATATYQVMSRCEELKELLG